MNRQRREFLRRIAAGSAVLSLPAYLCGCGLSPIAATTAPDNPFLDWFGTDEASLAAAMATLTVNAVDLADIYLQYRRSTTLRLQQGQVGTAEVVVLNGAGLRVVRDGETSYTYTEDLSGDALLTAARYAAGEARGASSLHPGGVAMPTSGADLWTELPWREVALERRIVLIQGVEEKIRQTDPSVTNVGIHWSDSDERVLVFTERGDLLVDQRPLTRLALQVTAVRDGATQSGFAHLSSQQGMDWYDNARIDALIDSAMQRTNAMFEARQPRSGEWPVILSARSASVLLHETIGHAFEADLVATGKSPYADSLGEKVADSSVTLVDDATLRNERGSLRVDDEGTSGQQTILVGEGVVRNFLHDRMTAGRVAGSSTGSGRRESYKFAPLPRMSCTVLQSGEFEADEIIASVDNGILAETFAQGQVELASGDFEFRVENGWLIERGEITYPVKDVLLAGNGPQMLRDVVMVGNDSAMDSGGWTCGKNGQRVPVSHGMPTALVSKLQVKPLVR